MISVNETKEYEDLLDVLCSRGFDLATFKQLIEVNHKTGYFENRIELFFILQPDSKSFFSLTPVLVDKFAVPRTLAEKYVLGRSNFKLIICSLLLFYNIDFSQFRQFHIDKVSNILTHLSFNGLQKVLNAYDSEVFKKPLNYSIKTSKEDKLVEIKLLIRRFIEFKISNRQYSDASSFKSYLKRFILFLTENKPYVLTLGNLIRKDIEDYIDYLKNIDYNSKNANRENFVYRNLRALYHFLQHVTKISDSLKEEQIPKGGLFSKQDFGNPNRKYSRHLPSWAREHILTYIRKMPEESDEQLVEKTILLLFFYVGTRWTDACTILKSCLIEKYNLPWIRIYSNKTKREYEVPIHEELEKYIKKCIERNTGGVHIHPDLGKKKEFLFWGDGTFESFKYSIYYLVRKVGSIAKYSALKDGVSLDEITQISITSHTFRHTVAINLCRMGADPLLVAEFLGHSDLQMAQSYLQEDEEYVNELLREITQDDLENWDQTELLPNNFDLDEVNLYHSREQLFNSGSQIKRVDGGWCVFTGDTPPCGFEGDECWFCSSLGPDLEDAVYAVRLKVLLKEHKLLIDYNKKHKYFGDVKREEKIILRIKALLKEWKTHEAKRKTV